MTNEHDLIGALDGIGFISVRPGELTIEEQAHIFSGARVIVGPEGAGFTNMGFAPAGCTVLGIMPAVGITGWWHDKHAWA